MSSARYLDAEAVLTELSLAYVLNDAGRLWTKNQVHTWLQAAGHRREGRLVVSRETLVQYFPEVAKAAVAPHLAIANVVGEYLYAVEVVGVFVKFGYTRTPRKRLATHVAMAKVHGRTVGRVWLSEQHMGALRNESAMKASQGGREYLPGHDFDEVVQNLQALDGAGPGRLFNGGALNGI